MEHVDHPYCRFGDKIHYFGGVGFCGALFRYFRDTFGSEEVEAGRRLGFSPYELLSMAAGKVPPGSDGLIVLPYFMGERTPIWDPLARGVVFGWSLAHTRSHLIRAMMESVAYGLRHNFELMKGSGIEIKYPLVMGEGGAQSAVGGRLYAMC